MTLCVSYDALYVSSDVFCDYDVVLLSNDVMCASNDALCVSYDALYDHDALWIYNDSLCVSAFMMVISPFDAL